MTPHDVFTYWDSTVQDLPREPLTAWQTDVFVEILRQDPEHELNDVVEIFGRVLVRHGRTEADAAQIVQDAAKRAIAKVSH